MKAGIVSAVALVCVLPALSAAQATTNNQEGETQEPRSDEIVVLGRSIATSSAMVEVQRELLVDTASVLKDIPGANVNMNGPITGIAQYRGMYGDRVAVGIDGLGIIGGGPNAMDSPLSYMSPMITEELVLSRGISSVSLAPESIGGYIGTKLSRGKFGSTEFGVSGRVGTRYSHNGSIDTTAARLTFADNHHRVSLLAEVDDGEDIDTPEGSTVPSLLHRERYDVSYAHRGDRFNVMLFAGELDTEHTGTAALPMDIVFIDTELYGARFGIELSDAVEIEGRVAYNDVHHVMDNHSMRQPPLPMRQRVNTAQGDGSLFSLSAIIDNGASELRIGVDGIAAEHNSVITNPNAAAFAVTNFSGVSRDLVGGFAEWHKETTTGNVELGVRVNRVAANAGDVGAAGMLGMMAMNAEMLADAFNFADRNLSWTSFDAVVKYRYVITEGREWSFELGSKARAPSYQELYLWLPMQATAGLADGRSYIGNLDLDEEHSTEIVIGYTSIDGRFGFSPQIFYRDVDDYIQGVPSANATANRVSTMMSGAAPLQFDNVDARIWGVDASWRYELTSHLLLDGNISIIRGRRSDIDDNLYRLSPYNGSIGITYQGKRWDLKTELIGYADQNYVSSTNNESRTAGYWRANVAYSWNPTSCSALKRVSTTFSTKATRIMSQA